MARPPATNDVFLREVDDELRRDQLIDLWRRWGRVGIAVLVAALAAFAGWLVWQNRADKAAGVEGEKLQAAVDGIANGQDKQVQPDLAALSGSNRPGYRALAELARADLLLQRKDVKGAVAQYAAVAADAKVGQPLRDLALIRQTVAEYDTLSPQAAIERLRPLAVPGNAWFGTAGELTALTYARQGRRDLAATLFEQLSTRDDVPQSIRQRAVQMASQMNAPTSVSGPTMAPVTGAKPRP